MAKNFGKLLISCLLAVGLASCSYRQIFFEFHEFFVTRVVVSFFDLNQQQKKVFKERWGVFARSFATSNLESLSKSIRNLTQSDEPAGVIDALQNIGKVTFTDACKIFAPLMADLSNEQLEYFKGKLEERNQKFDPTKNGGVEKHRQAKKNELVSTIEKWVGPISQAQKDLVFKLDEEKYREQPAWDHGYLSYSRDSQKAFVTIVTRNRSDVEKLQQSCSDYVRWPEQFLSDESKVFKAKLNQSRARLLNELFASLDDRQRQFLAQETRKLSLELTSWSQSLTE